MGKSPGKWIKSVLFGKKASRSGSAKGRSAPKSGTDKGYTVAKGPALTENSPVISEPVLISTHGIEINQELEKGNTSSLNANISLIAVPVKVEETQGIQGRVASEDPEKIREEQAAVKAQAAFRGFLARRAFHALKGIIRLQALVRGHLVRRQAVVTLHSMLGIIKLQALCRGQKVRASGLGHEMNTKFSQGKAVAPKKDSKTGKLYSNAFVCKLLSSGLVIMPLKIQYNQGEPNSVSLWMERWTYSHFWKPPAQPKKISDPKSQAKRSGYAMDTESGRPKRTVRRSSPATIDNGSSNSTSEPEKPKRNLRKITVSADRVQDNPQSELEKVKRNLRKVSSSYAEISEKSEAGTGTDTQSRTANKVVDLPTDTQAQIIDDLSEKMKKDISLAPEPAPEPKLDLEIAPKAVSTEVLVEPNSGSSLPTLEQSTPLNNATEEHVSAINAELNVKDEQTCNDNHKTSKRRSSFSGKPEYAENAVQNSPNLPSYMQATESAKAKLRGQNSPKFGSDSVEKNGITRRHSLPSSTNAKVTSHSPRTQRILQASAKGGVKSDKSMLSSRDGSEKLIQVEWRR